MSHLLNRGDQRARADAERGYIPRTIDDDRRDLARLCDALRPGMTARERDMIGREILRLTQVVACP